MRLKGQDFLFQLLLILLMTLGSCSTNMDQAGELAGKNQWLEAVKELRKTLKKDPGDQENILRLREYEQLAAQFYYQQGQKLVEQDEYASAIALFEQGLLAKPRQEKLLHAKMQAQASLEANNLFKEGMINYQAGNRDKAEEKFETALRIHPHHVKARAALAYMEANPKSYDQQPATTSTEPITLNFKNTELRTAFEFIAKSFGVNIVFDEGIKSTPITIFAKNVTFDQALNFLLASTQSFYKKIGPNSILIAPDTSAKREQYEDQVIKTYQLNSISAKEMLNIVKTLIKVDKSIINEERNSLIIRETPRTHRLIEKLVQLNDRKPAELIVEVEIIEVSHSRAQQFGLNFGEAITAKFDAAQTSTTGKLKDILSKGTINMGEITFRYFKQEANAKTLANPKVRVVHGETAKIHIGDKVPLRSSTVAETTGQIRTTFNYTDIGIRLQVMPEVHLDNSVTLRLGLEVSALGTDMGPVGEPAYSIGTRNAETLMMLRDGETAILGGLIRDEERRNRIKVPGLGDIPVVGATFTSHDDSNERKDLLLTMTPRVVRSWSLPDPETLEFYSGTIGQYTDKPLFDLGQKRGKKNAKTPIEIFMADWESEHSKIKGVLPKTNLAKLGLKERNFILRSQESRDYTLQAKNLKGASSLSFELTYSAEQILVGMEPGDLPEGAKLDFSESAKGIKAILRFEKPYSAEVLDFAKLKIKGLEPGGSHFLFKDATLIDEEGKRPELLPLPYGFTIGD